MNKTRGKGALSIVMRHRDNVVQWRDEGVTGVEIAKRLNIGYTAYYKAVRTLGLPKPKATAADVIQRNIDDVLQWRNDGVTNKECAERLGIGEKGFRLAASKLGLPKRGPLFQNLTLHDVELIGELADELTYKELEEKFECSHRTITKAIKYAREHAWDKKVCATLPRVHASEIYHNVHDINEPTVITTHNKPRFIAVPLEQWKAMELSA